MLLLALCWSLALLAACVGLLWYFDRRALLPGIVCPDRVPLLGSWPALLKGLDRFHDYKLEVAERVLASDPNCECVQRAGVFFRVVEVLSPRTLQFVLRDGIDNFEKGKRFRDVFQDLLGNGIFNSDGARWRETRQVASHHFSARQLHTAMLTAFLHHGDALIETMRAHCDRQRAQKEKAIKKGLSEDAAIALVAPVDAQRLFLAFTMDAICELGFGVQADTLAREERGEAPPPFSAAFDCVQEEIILRFLGPPAKFKLQRALALALGWLPAWVPLWGCARERRIRSSLRVIDTFVQSIVSLRKDQMRAHPEEAEQRNDLLSLFIADALRKKDGPSDDELRDTIMNFMLAGRDTTAALLTWLTYELAIHPEVYERVSEEVDRLFPSGTELTAELLKKATYLECVLLETLRLHPPIAGDNRLCVRECTLPDGSRLLPNTTVSFSPYTFGRLQSLWGPDVLEFRPERWLVDPDAPVDAQTV